MSAYPSGEVRDSAAPDIYRAPVAISTVDGLRAAAPGELRRRRWFYGTTTFVLAVLMALGVVGAFGWFDTYGVNDATVRRVRRGI